MALTKADRCDFRQCGAQAQVYAVLGSHGLAFCGHHYRQEEEALFLDGFYPIEDNRPALKARPADVEGA
jgi:hypothetical protein